MARVTQDRSHPFWQSAGPDCGASRREVQGPEVQLSASVDCQEVSALRRGQLGSPIRGWNSASPQQVQDPREQDIRPQALDVNSRRFKPVNSGSGSQRRPPRPQQTARHRKAADSGASLRNGVERIGKGQDRDSGCCGYPSSSFLR